MNQIVKSSPSRLNLAIAAIAPILLLSASNALASGTELNASSPDASSTTPGTIKVLSIDKAVVLRNGGKDSAQILWPENAPDAQMTITRVTMQPGAISDTHKHPRSEQVWLVEHGHGTMLLAEGKTQEIKAGDLVDTPPNTTHGVKNTGSEIFTYLSITTPPENFSQYYKGKVPPK